MRAKLELKGLDEYLEALAKAEIDIDAAVQRAVVKGGEIIEREMVRLVPKDERNLEAHINIDGPHQDGNFNYIEVGVVNADANTAIYGNVQEFGSPSKNIKAQPYIRPSIDGKRRAFWNEVKASLKAEGFVE